MIGVLLIICLLTCCFAGIKLDDSTVSILYTESTEPDQAASAGDSMPESLADAQTSIENEANDLLNEIYERGNDG